MSKPHKWAKEIKAWADGAEIEQRIIYDDYGEIYGEWQNVISPRFHAHDSNIEYRIKPQPKEPQYLYVYRDYGLVIAREEKIAEPNGVEYIGKIKLEQDE